MSNKARYCFNPFNLSNHSTVRNNLKNVTPDIFKRINVDEDKRKNLKICSTCRWKIFKTKEQGNDDEAPSTPPILFDPNEPTTTTARSPIIFESPDAGFSQPYAFRPKPSLTKSPIIFDSPDQEQELKSSQNSSIFSQHGYGTYVEPETSSATSTETGFTQDAVKQLNESLHTLRQSPIDQAKMRSKTYAERKAEKIHRVIQKRIFKKSYQSDGDQILQKLRKKFKSSNKISQKVQILTVVPLEWSRSKIQNQFDGATNHMIACAKKLAEEGGVLSTPNPKAARSLQKSTIDAVQNFYRSDDISRAMPGKKDFVVIGKGKNKSHVQKRLLLSNIKEIYLAFKEENPNVDIHFSKFAQLRPKECVIAGNKSSHNICVCMYHQNVKLMIEHGSFKSLSVENESPLLTYQDFIKKCVCEDATEVCYHRDCKKCNDTSEFFDNLKMAFERELIDEITYPQWILQDRADLVNIQQPINEFLNTFQSKLETLIWHDYITKKQSSFLKHVKTQLRADEIIVICDFAENHTFSHQDEAQSYHWSRDQATLHNFVIYFKESEDNSVEVQHLNFIIISESLVHDSAAVSLHIDRLIMFLKRKLTFSRMHFFSDGAAAQYKNRFNIYNLCQLKTQGIDADWNFFSTSHGKGPCDGIGGCVKRLATKASLQSVSEKWILKPHDLYVWCFRNIKHISFDYVSNLEQDTHSTTFLELKKKIKPLTGIRDFHGFKPIDDRRVMALRFSNATDGMVFAMM